MPKMKMTMRKKMRMTRTSYPKTTANYRTRKYSLKKPNLSRALPG
jgi:hypothetical protein